MLLGSSALDFIRLLESVEWVIRISGVSYESVKLRIGELINQ